MLNKFVTVTVDRPLGSFHPQYPDLYYPVNYGYIKGVMAPDGEEQDAYILGISEPVAEFTGRVIAIIHRHDDIEEKWVVAPDAMRISADEIMQRVSFQEQFFSIGSQNALKPAKAARPGGFCRLLFTLSAAPRPGPSLRRGTTG